MEKLQIGVNWTAVEQWTRKEKEEKEQRQGERRFFIDVEYVGRWWVFPDHKAQRAQWPDQKNGKTQILPWILDRDRKTQNIRLPLRPHFCPARSLPTHRYYALKTSILHINIIKTLFVFTITHQQFHSSLYSHESLEKITWSAHYLRWQLSLAIFRRGVDRVLQQGHSVHSDHIWWE